MEIRDSQWKLPKEVKTDTLSQQNITISPDFSEICMIESNKISFISQNGIRILDVPIKANEFFTCISTALIEPWNLCAGTNLGNIFFFDQTKYVTSVRLGDEIKFLKLNIYNSSHFTDSYTVILAKTSKILAVFTCKDILNSIQTGKEIVHQDYEFEEDFNSCVIINSKLSPEIFSGINNFPSLFAVSSDPFLTVSSLSKKTQYSFFSLFQNKYLSLNFEWALQMEENLGLDITCDPTGRYLSIVDKIINRQQIRIIIVDSIFGNVLYVFKGLRDAQVGWIRSKNTSYLMVFVSARKLILLYSMLNGNIISAFSNVDEKGKLIQFYESNEKFGISFIDSNGNIGIIDVKDNKTQIKNEEIKKEIEKTNKIKVDEDKIQKIRFYLMGKHINKEDIEGIIKEVNDVKTAVVTIKTMINYEETNDDLIIDTIKIFKSKFNFDNFNESSIEYFKRNGNSTQINDYVYVLQCYIKLTELWRKIVNFAPLKLNNKKIKIPFKDDMFNKFDNIMPLPEMINLKEFLLHTFHCPLFFFSFIREENITINDLLETYRISMDKREDFIMCFFVWITTAPVAQVLLADSLIKNFFHLEAVQKIKGLTLNRLAEKIRKNKILQYYIKNE